MNWYPWVVLAHVLGAFGFVMSHGVSVFAAFKIRGERDAARIGALLDLSSISLGGLYLSLLILLAAGIAAGFMGSYWDKAWIWVALVLLIATVVAMYPLGSTHYNKVRRAVGMKVYGDPKDAPPPEPASAEELAAVVSSSRPFILAGLGGVSLLVLIWLMVVQPF